MDPSDVSAVCRQVEVSATGWSLVQRCPTDCGVSECDIETSSVRRPWTPRVVEPQKKKKKKKKNKKIQKKKKKKKKKKTQHSPTSYFQFRKISNNNMLDLRNSKGGNFSMVT